MSRAARAGMRHASPGQAGGGVSRGLPSASLVPRSAPARPATTARHTPAHPALVHLVTSRRRAAGHRPARWHPAHHASSARARASPARFPDASNRRGSSPVMAQADDPRQFGTTRRGSTAPQRARWSASPGAKPRGSCAELDPWQARHGAHGRGIGGFARSWWGGREAARDERPDGRPREPPDPRPAPPRASPAGPEELSARPARPHPRRAASPRRASPWRCPPASSWRGLRARRRTRRRRRRTRAP